MSVQMWRRLKYDELFDDKPNSIEDYFEGVDYEILNKSVAALINAVKDERYKTAKELISNWLGKNPEIREELLTIAKDKDVIINIISSLNMAEFLLKYKENDEPKLTETEIELNLLKAYLLFNSNQNEIEDSGREDLPDEGQNKLRIIGLILAMNFHDFDLVNYDIREILITQLAKSIEFFKYLSSRKELNPHLDLFLSKYGVKTWKEWLKGYLALMPALFPDKPVSYFDFDVVKDDKYDFNCRFLDSLSLSDTESFKLSDYIALRSNPLIKIDDGRYRVLFNLFLVEKIFKSIQFQFSLEINKELPKDQRLKDFRADHCDLFSEQTLLYNILRNSFPKKWVHISGEEFVNQGYSAEPDYYLRHKTKILLFESKDVVLKGDEKQSRNFKVLSQALEHKFYKIEKDGEVQKKAILQLVNNIKRIHSKYYEKNDTDYNIETVRIYPILVVHDRQFESLAVNQIIQEWFSVELQKIKEEINIKNVNGLVVLNIDKLILYQESFKSRAVNFEKLISDYIEFSEIDKIKARSLEEYKFKAMQRLISFSTYIDIEMDKKRINKMPKYIENYIKELKE